MTELEPTENRLDWASHRTQDPTGLVKIRIELERMGVTENQQPQPVQEPEAPKNPEEEDAKDGKPLEDLIDTSEVKITCDIDWQQKIFSPTEVKNAINGTPISDNPSLANKYHDQIIKRRQENDSYSGNEIFTKVAEDRYIDPSEIDTPFYNPVGERDPNELAEAVLQGKGHEEMVEVVRLNAQTMHIFASIPCRNGTVHEELLGIIRVFPGGRIDVRPPFSNKCNREYRFFTPSSEIVRYRFNVIENAVESETPFEHTLLSDIKRRRAIFEAGQADSSLAQAPDPPGTVRMFYRGEIARAIMDTAPGVAVEYQLRLPPGWANEETGIPVQGCSQYSLCDENGVSAINLPIDLVARAETQTAPTLYLTLHSYTPDGARIVEGYGQCALPMSRGCHEIEVPVWRIRGRVSEELRLMFLDSGLEQQAPVEQTEDDKFGALTADTVYNRFGLRTVGAGKVIVRFNLAMQSSLFGRRPQTNMAGTMSMLGSSQPSRMSTIASRLTDNK
ncbi:hypothetical protein TVAG_166340 [Trichomonas vaginalis G3]|uniref:Uncharacterized protein n=1 Tax=Trichomonas vaginalis (strain ATCC PRA-98 / G3) TaxID=412133 RepID=A2DE41_TRIV3|nr:smoothened signaling pathway protein [Trichomonas vaginalis G3]EAY21259.1 hypothetical protein TVAG_166340 [Trichomonas vaginalis G3]KAI5548833.1 smoothened signaling pathway protein [Trichomonas vaginalis G3]|eukprot:XP_001582245.1 hypothetical protein [Trichomonas vaginalis G3]